MVPIAQVKTAHVKLAVGQRIRPVARAGIVKRLHGHFDAHRPLLLRGAELRPLLQTVYYLVSKLVVFILIVEVYFFPFVLFITLWFKLYITISIIFHSDFLLCFTFATLLVAFLTT